MKTNSGVSGALALVKGLIRGLAFILVAPLLLWYAVATRLVPGRRDQVHQGISQLLSLVPGVTGSFIRVAFFSRVFLSCGRGLHIGFGTIFATPDVRVGDRVYLGAFCNIGHVDFGDDVLVGSNVTILSGKHQHRFGRTDIPMNQQGGEYERIAVGEDSWLGNGSIVMSSVEAHSIVAAGAVASKTQPKGSILAGNPAGVIKNRFED